MEADLNTSDSSSDEELEAIHCRLANGHKVVFMCEKFWIQPTAEDRREGQSATELQALRIYTNGELGAQRTRLAYEFRLGKDFELDGLQPSWAWLRELIESRALYDYDTLDDLMTDFALELEKAAVEGDNAVSHYEHLPELTLPYDFDHWDDSLANDQEDKNTNGGDH